HTQRDIKIPLAKGISSSREENRRDHEDVRIFSSCQMGCLAACSWPGYIPAPLFAPYISGSMHHPSQTISKWRVIMDVAHFSPSEISLSIRDGFLEVRGKHEERPDEHGFIARCFTRKYRLPVEMDATKISSTFSVDGFLNVEAPVSETSVPATIPIPIKVLITWLKKYYTF
uniref:Heat shock protein beta-1-like n=1 Tax=Neolamprologus brichardi TaxID=32507 RepID=A0A3Q4HRZ9_NEOBR